MKDKQEVVVTPEFQSVIDAIDRRVPFLFINGKAGTGKSTLTRLLKAKLKEEKRNAAFVAPTGIAALNIGGSTINSLFKFPPRILLPKDIHKPKDPSLFRSLDMLFIDEISMTRCDMLDSIDLFLRKARDNKAPFGGLPIVAIGDLFQLPPVVTKTDAEVLLQMKYPAEARYFFDAKVFSKMQVLSIELTHVFRQEDRAFADLLSRIRVGDDVGPVLAALNRRCHGRKPHELAITLATTNAIADTRNASALAKLPGQGRKYNGLMSGKFAIDGRNLPSPMDLHLKEGAQVMFTANDSEWRWQNGSLGTVVTLGKDYVVVRMASGDTVEVSQNEWKSFEYFLDGAKKLQQREAGKYSQIPLTLAWSVTIHKSQGQSLEFLHVDMGSGAFATGQTYVALSRARNVEGMTFEQQIRMQDVRCCQRVKQFLQSGATRPGSPQRGLF